MRERLRVISCIHKPPRIEYAFFRPLSRARVLNAITKTTSRRHHQEKMETPYVTPKVFANSSPGFALKPWDPVAHRWLVSTLKGLRRHSIIAEPSLQSCDEIDGRLSPGFQGNLGLTLANASAY